MRRIYAYLAFALFPAAIGVAGEPSTPTRSMKTVPRTYVLSANSVIDKGKLEEAQCKPIKDIAVAEVRYALVACSSSPDKVIAMANQNSWNMRTVTEYKELGLSDSVLLSVAVLTDAQGVRNSNLAYFFPAQGESRAERSAWMKMMLRDNAGMKDDLSIVLVDRDGKYLGFNPGYNASSEVWSNINTPYGLSVKASNVTTFMAMNPTELRNSTRIVGE